MLLSQIRAQAVLVALIPIVVLASMLVYVLDVRAQTRAAALSAEHTRAILGTSAAYLLALSAENRLATRYQEERGAGFSARLRRARTEFAAAGDRLLTLGSSSAIEEARARTLVRRGREADAFLMRYLHLEQTGDKSAARRMAEAPSTAKLSVKLRTAFDRFDSTERALATGKLLTAGSLLSHFSRVLAVALIAGMLLFLLSSITLGARIALRARRLRENAQRLRLGGNPPPLQGNDELAAAEREYRDVLRRLREEHGNATLLQRALLPQRLPSIPGVRIDAFYAPSSNQSVIGGDWYDVFPLGDGRLGISVGDVGGHGLEAAATMAMIRQSVRTAARLSPGPARVLQAANRIAYDDSVPLVTMFYADLSLATGILRYAVAGHPTPITVRASGVVEQLHGEGLIMGVERRAEYEEYALQLDSGSGIVLFTDGLVEQGRTFRRNYDLGIARLIDVVNRQYYSATENIAHAIARDVFAGTPPLDDTAVLFIGITDLGTQATASRTWRLDATSAAAARRTKRAFLWHLGEFAADGTDLSESELIFGELVGNVARHTAGRAEITLEIVGNRALLRVCDEGGPIVHVQPAPDQLSESGRGLLLVEHLARAVDFERTPYGNRISVELPVKLDRYDAGVVASQRVERGMALTG